MALLSKSRVERGLEATAQNILERDSNGGGNQLSVFGKRMSQDGTSRDRSNEVYESRFGHQLDTSCSLPVRQPKLSSSQLI